MIKIKKVCKICQSEEIVFDANVVWNKETQGWEVAGLMERVCCNHCGWETNDYTDVEIKPTKRKESMTDISTSYKIKQVTESLNELLQEKNKRYGNSALEPLEGIKYTAEDGIKIRIADKIKRVINSDELRKNDISDILGYLVLLCVHKDWTSFKDLID